MVKYIIGFILSLGIISQSFAQNDSLQSPMDSSRAQSESETDEMVCFLTDANTITCFVAPEGYDQQQGQQQLEDGTIVPDEEGSNGNNPRFPGEQEQMDQPDQQEIQDEPNLQEMYNQEQEDTQKDKEIKFI